MVIVNLISRQNVNQVNVGDIVRIEKEGIDNINVAEVANPGNVNMAHLIPEGTK